METHTLEVILREHPFLQKLSEKHIQLLTGCAKNVRFRSGELIFREGGEAEHLYLIRDGKVGLEMFSPDRGSITIQTLHNGDLLGWSWLIAPYLWHFDARAQQDTRLFCLDAKCLRKKCDEDTELGYFFMKEIAHIIAQRLEMTRLQLLDVYGSGERRQHVRT